METWLILALLSPAGFALANVFDKFLVEKRIQNCFALAVTMGWLELLAAFIVLFFVPFQGLTLNLVVLGILNGLIYGMCYFLYYYAISFEEVSRVISIYYVTPIIVLVFARFFLGETLPSWKYVAAVVTVLGAVLIGVERLELKFKLRRAFWIAVFTCILWAVVNILQKHLLNSLSFWNVFVLQSFGVCAVLSATLLLPFSRRHFWHVWKSIHIVWIPEAFNLFGIILYLAAFSLTEVSRASPIGSVQPLYLLVFMLFLSIFIPKFLKEEFTRETIAIKIVSTLMIVIGAYFVAV
jgi:drug/metabolite transporter (DMT)-like permease